MSDSDFSSHPSQSHPVSHRGPFFILALAVLLVWGSSIAFDCTIWDDNELIMENPMIVHPSVSNFVKFWTRPHFQIYMPLTYSLWMIEGLPARYLPAVPGTGQGIIFAPWVFHLVNIAFFIGLAYQAYRLIQRLIPERYAALIGALFLALHPMQDETVCWLSENKGLMATFFGLWALGYYIDAVRSSDRKLQRRLYILATILYLIALSAKPSAVIIPVMAAIIDFCFLSSGLIAVIKRVALWIAAAFVMVAITQHVQTTASLSSVAWPKRPFIALDSLTFYLQKILVPYPLLIDYGRSPSKVLASVSSPELVGSLAWAGIATVLLILVIRKKWKLLGVISLFLAGLLPNLGWSPFAFQAFSTVADRYGAPALLAAALAIAWMAQQLKTPARAALLLVPVAVLGGMSLLQSQVWRSNDPLFSHTIAHNPDSPAALINRSKWRYMNQDYEGSIADARQCIRAASNFLPAYLNVAGSLEVLGRHEEAMQAVDDVRSLSPDYIPALEFQIYLLQYLKRYKDAIPSIERLRELVGDNQSLKMRHARLLVLSGDVAKGLAMFVEDRPKRPSPVEMDFIEAQIFDQSQEFKEAIKRYRFIVNHYAKNVEPAELRLAWLLATATQEELRKPQEALLLAQRLLKRAKTPTAQLLDTLAAAQAATNDFASAAITANDAKKYAESSGNLSLAKEIAQRMELYQAKKAYTIPPLKFLAPNIPRS
jgi:tetratricopeptide (TPR) repeat protein